jgi:hypothetical protein
MKPLHFLLRVPRLTRLESRPAFLINTIECHEELVRTRGQVSIAKFGKPCSIVTVERLTEQISKRLRTCLILVARNKHEYLGREFPIVSILRGSPTDKIKNAAPAYYQELSYGAELWFTVRGPMRMCNLAKLKVARNDRPVLDILNTCQLPSMLVTSA